MSEKKLTESQLLGSQGTGLIELVVSRMGLVWRPTAQHDAGIDGEIEIREASTGRMTGMLLKVQSKALSEFKNETDIGFDYWPDARDLGYWLSHSVPVVLIVSKPSTNECYWQVIKPPADGGEKRLRFVKARDALNEDSKGRLIEVAQAASPRGVAPALAKHETLVSNLLPIAKLPERLYLAETSYKTAKELGAALYEANLRLEFVLKNGRILTVRDLTDPRFRDLCDSGTVEDFGVKEWAASSDADKQRDFVNIINSCLREKLRSSPQALRFDKETKCFFFPPSENKAPYDYAYRGDKKATAREVFKELRNKKQKHVSVPYYATYPGMYVPRPLKFQIAHAETSPRKLAEEILALTKLNWNNTQFDGSEPITMRVAHQVGKVLKYVLEGDPVQPRYSFYM